jgi:hypothetical protein
MYGEVEGQLLGKKKNMNHQIKLNKRFYMWGSIVSQTSAVVALRCVVRLMHTSLARTGRDQLSQTGL